MTYTTPKISKIGSVAGTTQLISIKLGLEPDGVTGKGLVGVDVDLGLNPLSVGLNVSLL